MPAYLVTLRPNQHGRREIVRRWVVVARGVRAAIGLARGQIAGTRLQGWAHWAAVRIGEDSIIEAAAVPMREEWP